MNFTRRGVLAGAASALACPAVAQGDRASTLRFIPQADVTVVGPLGTTAYPTRIPALAMPEAGFMTLVSPHVAEFTDPAGNRIRFVDSLPGEINHPYPLAVRVLSGGNHILDEPFAGRHWQTTETLPGVVGLPYGNGMDRVTFVQGIFIIADSEDAIFKSDAGGVLHFSAVPPMGCD